MLITELEYKDDSINLPIHFHSDYEIIFIESGSVEIVVGNHKIVANKNDIIILGNHESHSINIIKNPYKRYYLSISPTELNKYFSNLSIYPNIMIFFSYYKKCMHINSSKYLKEIFERMLYEIKNNDEYSDELLFSYLKELFIYMIRNHNTLSNLNTDNKIIEQITKVKQYIDGNYKNDIKINKICKEIFISPPYFSRIFKEHIGQSPKQYLTYVRLNSAGKELTNTNKTITDIAFNNGFKDVNNFIRKFKETFFVTPGEIRKTNHLI